MDNGHYDYAEQLSVICTQSVLLQRPRGGDITPVFEIVPTNLWFLTMMMIIRVKHFLTKITDTNITENFTGLAQCPRLFVIDVTHFHRRFSMSTTVSHRRNIISQAILIVHDCLSST